MQNERILGHTWEAIQRAQCGGSLHDRISGPIVKPQATDDDRALLAKHGLAGLEAMQFHGASGRLRESRLDELIAQLESLRDDFLEGRIGLVSSITEAKIKTRIDTVKILDDAITACRRAHLPA